MALSQSMFDWIGEISLYQVQLIFFSIGLEFCSISLEEWKVAYSSVYLKYVFELFSIECVNQNRFQFKFSTKSDLMHLYYYRHGVSSEIQAIMVSIISVHPNEHYPACYDLVTFNLQFCHSYEKGVLIVNMKHLRRIWTC